MTQSHRQPQLPGMPQPQGVVNVASVPHRSPFRYPGGKTWLVPRSRVWLASHLQPPAQLVEPFAGGAIVGLTAAFEGLAKHVTLAELDPQVAAVWQVIINAGDGEWLASQIQSFELTAENVASLLANESLPIHKRALQTIVRNRVNRGGILAKGAGMLKHGENGRGITSRWYPDTLAKRIRAIDGVRERLTFMHGDGLACIQQHVDEPDCLFFIDPPYTASGTKPGARLYDCWQLDHDALFDLMAQAKGDFLMTYDNAPHIRDMAAQHGFDIEAVSMKNTHHAKKQEVLIGRDLSWAR
jgi:DNA adenine methylase